MKKFVLHIFLMTLVLPLFSQQFPHYTQFIFNKIGYNPAASGTSLNAPFEIIFGGRTQWIGINNNPKSQFVSLNYNFVPQRSYHAWHNVGVYVDQDQNGLFTKNDVWLSYTYHMHISKKLILSAGVFAGIKQFKLNTADLDRADPAVQASSSSVLAYPDIVPGIRISNKKTFLDFSLQQLTMYKQKGIGGAIGSPSKLTPHYNVSAGRKGILNEFNTIMFAINLRGSFIGLPSAEFNMMNYFNKRFGYGFSIRGKDFISGIIQFRLLRNFNVGMAYDLAINKVFKASPHTVEVMLGISPVFNGEVIKKATQRIVDDCTF